LKSDWLAFLVFHSRCRGKRCDLEHENSGIQEYIAVLRANQFTRITSDFKMDVITWQIGARRINHDPKHIEFHSDYIRIFVPRSKTDVYREGIFVFISASRSKYCPVGVLQRYLDLSSIDLCSSLPLFRPFVFHRSSSSYTLRSGKIS